MAKDKVKSKVEEEVKEVKSKIKTKAKVETKVEDKAAVWEAEVKEKLNEFITNLLSVSKECNMGTRYFKEIKEQYETHIEYDENMVNAAELRIVFSFVEPIDKTKTNLI